MTDPGAVRPKRSVFALVRQLVSGGVALAKLELEHGRQEMSAMLSRAKGGVVLLLLAFVLLFGGPLAGGAPPLRAAALARKAIERFLTDEADRPRASGPSAAADYSGISSRGRSSGGPWPPARE